MDRIEKCKVKFKELFGTEQSVDLEDPDFMTLLQRFIFGEVFFVGDLTNQQREMITCTVLAVMQTLPQLRVHVNVALNTGVSPIELKEAIYQCAPFIGYPKTINAIGICNEVFEERGINLPLSQQYDFLDEDRYNKGIKIQEKIYGSEIKDKYDYLPAEFKDALPRFLTEWCFGDFYVRQDLNVQSRELLIFCILVTLNSSSQLYSHALGNIKVGNTLNTLYSALIQCLPYVGFPAVLNAFNAIKALEQDENEK